MSKVLTLESFRLLGRSGLRVSPLALGTMTFGSEWGWGADRAEAQRIFDEYTSRGGNFIDTANQYTNGTAEMLIGDFAVDCRDRLVIGTKYALPTRARDPNSGGNHRKSMVRSVETSLKRLRTDYIDLLYLHAWDDTTPVEEILRAMDDLVRAGKVLYLGLSDIVAWQVSRMQTMADLRGWTALIALQMEYSLIERTGERELIPMAQAMGLGVIPWSPLGSGVLTGKYRSRDLSEDGLCEGSPGTRKAAVLGNRLLTEHGLRVAEVVKRVAAELNKSPAQVALAWTLLNPGVVSPLIGARTLAQLKDNLGALEVTFDEEHRTNLEQVSAITLGFPHDYLKKVMAKDGLFGSTRAIRGHQREIE